MRSWSLAVSAIALLLAAAALAATLGNDATPPIAATAPPRPDEAQSRRIASLEQGLDQALADLDEQRRQTETLRELVDDLLGATGRPAAAKTQRPAAARANAADEGATSLAALDPFGTGGTSTLAVPRKTEQEVRAVLARVNEERQRERDKRQEERQRQRSARVIRDVRERLGLTDDQATLMTTALLARDVGRRKAWSDGESDTAARRAAAEAIDQQYELTLQQLLSPAQCEELEAVRKESSSSGGRRQRRGRRGR